MLAAGVGSTLYKVLLSAHILLAIVGLGGVTLNGIYAGLAKERPGPQGRAISEANYRVSAIAEVMIVLVPVTGLLLVWASSGVWAISDLWVWLSLVATVVALLVSRTVLMPGHRRINELLAEAEVSPQDQPPPQLAEIERLGSRQGPAGATLNILLLVVIVLMIWQPTG